MPGCSGELAGARILEVGAGSAMCSRWLTDAGRVGSRI